MCLSGAQSGMDIDCSPDALPVSELFDNADNALFRAIINNSSHILGHFLSIKSRNNYSVSTENITLS